MPRRASRKVKRLHPTNRIGNSRSPAPPTICGRHATLPCCLLQSRDDRTLVAHCDVAAGHFVDALCRMSSSCHPPSCATSGRSMAPGTTRSSRTFRRAMRWRRSVSVAPCALPTSCPPTALLQNMVMQMTHQCRMIPLIRWRDRLYGIVR